jgi:hypothetical protein
MMNRNSLRRLLCIVTVGAIAGVFILPLNPVNSTLTRLLFTGAIFVGWLGLLYFFGRNRIARVFLIGIPVLLALFLALPGRPIDPVKLRSDYLEELRSFEDVPYVWGGESGQGIDCSGLPRRSYRNALLTQAWRGNSKALLLYLSQWWHDASAKALSEGYRDNTVPLEVTGKMDSMDHSSLQPGDLAVSLGGAHMLVYIGEGKWIQADPGLGKVATLHHQKDKNPWFQGRVTTHRWSIFNSAATTQDR